MAPVNSLVDEHQEKALSLFPGQFIPPLIVSCKVTRVRSNRATGPNGEIDEAILPEMTHRFAPTGVAPHRLLLKIGVPVMIIRDVLFPHLVNGKVVVVIEYRQYLLVLGHTDSRTGAVTTNSIPRINFVFTCGQLQVHRRQFPVRLTFAATVHKSQSRTLDRVVVDLRKDFFCAGMLYVALSIPFSVRNPILQAALDFATNAGVVAGEQTLE